jgi:hypothetical protein
MAKHTSTERVTFSSPRASPVLQRGPPQRDVWDATTRNGAVIQTSRAVLLAAYHSNPVIPDVRPSHSRLHTTRYERQCFYSNYGIPERPPAAKH